MKIERRFLFNIEDESLVGFKIHYADGSIASGVGMADWMMFPADNVEVVALFQSKSWELGRHRYLLHSYDFYWFNGETFGQTNFPASIPPGASIKAGKELDKESFHTIFDKAHGDRIWP